MDEFLKSCGNYLHYPNNLTKPGNLRHSLQAYHDRLERQIDQLFDVEQRAAVDLFDHYGGRQGMDIGELALGVMRTNNS